MSIAGERGVEQAAGDRDRHPATLAERARRSTPCSRATRSRRAGHQWTLWCSHGGRVSNVTFNTLTITQTDASGLCMNFHDPSDLVIDGITAVGGSSLLMCATVPTYYPTNCVIKNGAYEGPRIGSVRGVEVTDVTMI